MMDEMCPRGIIRKAAALVGEAGAVVVGWRLGMGRGEKAGRANKDEWRKARVDDESGSQFWANLDCLCLEACASLLVRALAVL